VIRRTCIGAAATVAALILAPLTAGRAAEPVASAKAPAPKPKPDPVADGPDWQSLFNGKDLTGWAVKCKPADRTKMFWKVDKSAILADSMGFKGHDYVWLYSEQEYGDFVLRLRFQVSAKSKGNSGVQIRSRYDDKAGWLDGPQVDIHPAGPWRCGMIWDETRGSKRWLWPPVPKGKWVAPSMAVKGIVFHHAADGGKWNEIEITAIGTKLRASLNGTEVMKWDGKGLLDDETHKTRNVGLKGHIALQIHRGDRLRIRFRDIRILHGKALADKAARAKLAGK
jgi:hypothetical protein